MVINLICSELIANTFAMFKLLDVSIKSNYPKTTVKMEQGR